ncbi:hypothetical protein GM182_01810 [bacterium 3DAC]|nr:hypothetical protein [Dictyoglomota bacterium]UZN22671.1 hypothetical protein GM182_01810 [bacterium 3DAC]
MYYIKSALFRVKVIMKMVMSVWLWNKYIYQGYVRKLKDGMLFDPWVVHLGSLYMFFSGDEEDAISTVRVALSFQATPLLVRTLGFLEGMYRGIEGVYDVYRRYFRKIFTEGQDVSYYQWDILLAGDLAFYMGHDERGWFYYKKFPQPHSEYMLRRKARLFFETSPNDSKTLYEMLVKEKKKLSLGDMLRYAYLLGPIDGRAFLNKIGQQEQIEILLSLPDKDFDYIIEYLKNLEEAPVFEGTLTARKWRSEYIALSVEVLAHLLGGVYMPWSDMILRRHGFLKDKLKIPYYLWDSGYAYEYHYAYLPPWWRMGVEYLEYIWGVRILVLSRSSAGKRRCIWGSRHICANIVDRYDRLAKPIVEV